MPDAVRRRQPWFYPARILLGRPRLVVAIIVAVLAYIFEPFATKTATRMLIAWNASAIVYITLNLIAMAGATTKTIRWRAAQTDEGQFAILVLVCVAATASLVGIFAHLGMTKDMHGLPKGLHVALAGLTIVTAWVFIHLSFALHYAHEYFDEAKTEEGEKPKLKGGLNFPETDEPDYWDFLYFSFIIGVAAQTADVSITSKVIRRTSLAHSVLSFFFNSAILALTINIAAGLI